MAQTRIAVIVGSLRKESWNRRMANALAKLAPAGVELVQVEIGDLPLFNQDHEKDPGDAVRRLKSEIAASQGVIFVTPEYNRSIPGVLKNAIDHGSRPYGQSAWKGKPAGVIGVSPGAMSTALAQQHLRNVLTAVDMPTSTHPEAFVHAKEGVFEASGELSESTAKFVKGWLDAYLAFAKRITA
jgi:chromate reductase, NAD(P)H dehydrogenase (quinone)